MAARALHQIDVAGWTDLQRLRAGAWLRLHDVDSEG